MAVTISGIRVNDIHIEPHVDQSGFQTGYKIKSAEYSLISSTGKVLARQVIGGYQGMALEPSTETKAALEEFTRRYAADVQGLLGLLE